MSITFWLLIAATGVGAGWAGGLLMKLLFAIQAVSWPHGAGDFVDAVARASVRRHLLVLLAAGVFGGVARRLIRLAPGGHAGELSETIWFRSGRFPLLAMFARAVVSIVIVGMGAAVGREGALKQSGAAIASKLSDWRRLPAEQRRLLAACGAGAGMAAAYNVPFGEALFALEVLLGTLSLPLVVPALACSAIATACSWMFLPVRPSYAVPGYGLSWQQVAWAAIVGPLFGLASAAYIRLITWADRRRPAGKWMLLAPVLVLPLLGLAACVFPELLGNGKDVVQRALDARLPLVLLAALTLLRPLATAACLGSGVPGGLFTPTMTAGALLGGTLGQLWSRIAGPASAGAYALLGSAAMLAAATEGPVSSVVLVLELTRRADAIMVPLLIAAFLATAVSRRVEKKSIYSARVRQGEAAALRQASNQGVALPVSTPYSRAVRRLLAATQSGAPVFAVDAEGRVVGEVTAEAAVEAAGSAVPLEIATAGDLARRTPAFERLPGTMRR